jgi:type IV pilus assembly protein PilW
LQAGSDVLVVRHASGATTAPTNNVIQIVSNRVGGSIFNNGAPPLAGACPPTCVYDWQTHAYYVSSTSSMGANVPSLRRKSLVNGVFQDQELVPGVEDFQVQLGVDTNGDNTVDRYVDAGAAILDPLNAGFNPNARVLAVHLWLMFRSERAEVGFVDGNVYNYADVVNYAPNDGFRRALVNKTILLRNVRS